MYVIKPVVAKQHSYEFEKHFTNSNINSFLMSKGNKPKTVRQNNGYYGSSISSHLLCFIWVFIIKWSNFYSKITSKTQIYKEEIKWIIHAIIRQFIKLSHWKLQLQVVPDSFSVNELISRYIIYIYIYIKYVHVYVYICTGTCIYMFICIYVCTCTIYIINHLHVCIYVHV